MIENEIASFPLHEARDRSSGKRDCDAVAKKRLIELCCHLACQWHVCQHKAGVDPKRLNKWICEHEPAVSGSVGPFVNSRAREA